MSCFIFTIQVPDPGNGDQSLGDSWPELRVENLIQGNSSLKSYSDKEHHPFLRMTGVSSLQLVCPLLLMCQNVPKMFL